MEKLLTNAKNKFFALVKIFFKYFVDKVSWKCYNKYINKKEKVINMCKLNLVNFDEVVEDIKMKVFYELYSCHDYESWTFGEKISNERLKMLTGLSAKQWITQIDKGDYQLFETFVDSVNEYYEWHGASFVAHQPTLIWWLINHRNEYNKYSKSFKDYVSKERAFMTSWTRGKGCKPEPCYLNNECYDFYEYHNCYNPNSYDMLIDYLDKLS